MEVLEITEPEKAAESTELIKNNNADIDPALYNELRRQEIESMVKKLTPENFTDYFPCPFDRDLQKVQYMIMFISVKDSTLKPFNKQLKQLQAKCPRKLENIEYVGKFNYKFKFENVDKWF